MVERALAVGGDGGFRLRRGDGNDAGGSAVWAAHGLGPADAANCGPWRRLNTGLSACPIASGALTRMLLRSQVGQVGMRRLVAALSVMISLWPLSALAHPH